MSMAWRVRTLRVVVYAALLVGVLVLQTAAFSFLPFYGVHPDLTLLVVLSLGFLRGPAVGSALGAAGGFLSDMLTGQFIGLDAVIMSLLGCLAGLVGTRLVVEKLYVPVGLSAVATPLHLFLYAIGVAAFGSRLPFLEGFATLVWPLIAYNALAMIAVHPLCVFVHRLFETKLVLPRRNVGGTELHH